MDQSKMVYFSQHDKQHEPQSSSPMGDMMDPHILKDTGPRAEPVLQQKENKPAPLSGSEQLCRSHAAEPTCLTMETTRSWGKEVCSLAQSPRMCRDTQGPWQAASSDIMPTAVVHPFPSYIIFPWESTRTLRLPVFFAHMQVLRVELLCYG